MLDDASRDQSLRWLEGLPPGYFALVMATGILAIAFQMIGQLWLYEVMSVLTWVFWGGLLLLSAWRLLRFPHAVKIDLLNIRRGGDQYCGDIISPAWLSTVGDGVLGDGLFVMVSFVVPEF